MRRRFRILLIIFSVLILRDTHAGDLEHIIPNAQLMILPGMHGSFLGEVCTNVEGSKMPELTVAAVIEFLDTDTELRTLIK